MLVAVGVLHGYQQRAQALAATDAHVLAPRSLPMKSLHLTLQRGALKVPNLLPIYGTSELYCCAAPFNPTRVFQSEPDGFAVYAVGYPLTTDLFFAETFAALGHQLRGKKVVVSDSPWFFQPESCCGPSHGVYSMQTKGVKGQWPLGTQGLLTESSYDHVFSPDTAMVFAFDAPISLGLRQDIASRMLAYPQSLNGMTLLREGLVDLADHTRRGTAAYLLLDPVGRLDAWITQLHGAQTVYRWLRSQHIDPHAPIQPRTLDWQAMLRQADALAAQQSSNNPFGVTNSSWTQCHDVTPAVGPWCSQALALYRQGKSNANGGVYPYPQAFVDDMKYAPEWTDLQLELAVLTELGAKPFVYVQPLQGYLLNYTPLSRPVRETLYQRYQADLAAAGVPGTTFAQSEGDRYFLNTFGHFSQRGWVYADLTLDLFWHGQLGLISGPLSQGGSVGPLLDGQIPCPADVGTC